MTLRQRFKEDFAGSAFQEHCGDPSIVGKYGVITELEDALYDVWIVYPDGSPLSERKLTILEKKCPLNWGFVRLTGEGYMQGRGSDFVREIAPIIGVRKKRKMTAEQKAKAAANLVAHRPEYKEQHDNKHCMAE